MNERLTMQGLVNLLVNRHRVPRKNVDVFARELFLLIEQTLENDQYVKIKELGIFKLIGVNGRESANVSTSERIKIEGHTGISFTPDPSLRDIINRSFSHFETAVLSENTILEDTLVEEPEGDPVDVPEVEETQFMKDVSIETEPIEVVKQTETAESEGMLEQSVENAETTTGDIEEDMKKTGNIEIGSRMVDVPEEAEKETCKGTGTKIIIEVERLSVDGVSEDIRPDKIDKRFEKEQEQVEKEIEEGKVPKLTAEEITVRGIQKTEVSIVPMGKERYPQRETEFKKEKSPAPYLITIVAIVMLPCDAALVFVYYPDLSPRKEMQSTIIEAVEKKEPIKEAPLNTVMKTDTIAEVMAKIQDRQQVVNPKPMSVKTDRALESKSAAQEKVTKKVVSIPVKSDSIGYIITGIKTIYTIKEGEALAKIPLRFYGMKDLWSYIVKHNQGVTENPNSVLHDVVLRISELAKK